MNFLAEDDDGRFPERQNAAGVRCPTSFAVDGIVLRTVFIGLLMVLILRVSQPQSKTIWSAYETTGELVRLD
jgi:hypothetical protein